MPRVTNFHEAQAALRPFYNNARTPYTLDTMRALMNYLGNPQDELMVIHVAGTSGKTSTAYYAAALLRYSHKTVGLSVSPHVDTVNERLQINGLLLEESEYCRVLSEFLELIDAAPVRPSYFELLVAMAYWQFAKRGLEYAVIEVGLGGLLDGTNVVSRQDKVCVITDIGLDHTEILGDTLAEIAAQKAGIIYSHNKVFMYQQDSAVMQVVDAVCREQEASLHVIPDGQAVDDPTLPLFQQRNLGLAIAATQVALGEVRLTSEAISSASRITVPARLEQFKVHEKIVIIDGSHNQQKLHVLMQSIQALHPNNPLAVLCGFLHGNEDRWQGGLREIFATAEHVIFTSFSGEQDMPRTSVGATDLSNFADAEGYHSYTTKADPRLALEHLLQRPEPILLVTGSFYLLNHIRPLIGNKA